MCCGLSDGQKLQYFHTEWEVQIWRQGKPRKFENIKKDSGINQKKKKSLKKNGEKKKDDETFLKSWYVQAKHSISQPVHILE